MAKFWSSFCFVGNAHLSAQSSVDNAGSRGGFPSPRPRDFRAHPVTYAMGSSRNENASFSTNHQLILVKGQQYSSLEQNWNEMKCKLQKQTSMDIIGMCLLGLGTEIVACISFASHVHYSLLYIDFMHEGYGICQIFSLFRMNGVAMLAGNSSINPTVSIRSPL